MENSTTVNVNGLETFVYREGSGPPLVMLHGMAATSDCWTYVYEKLKTNYTTIAPDLPGHGRSAGGSHPYSLDFYLRWLVGFLETIEVDKPILMGASMGGAISLAYTAAYQERVDRLILVDALGMGTRFSLASRMIFQLPYFIAGMLTHRADPYLFRYFQPWSFRDSWGPAGKIIARMADVNRRQGVWPLWAGMRLLLTDFLLPGKLSLFNRRLDAITQPTLITWGRHDALLPVANALTGAKQISNARLRVFENSAHAPMLEEPEAFNRTVLEFLKT
jgi:4,5:9,10-diseco-3-hydroxy-5,9,17-trioxoandrosta-1(10),2-diene-4-oate hydrolase